MLLKAPAHGLSCLNIAAFLNSIVFYSVFTLLPLYLTDATVCGGLGMEMGKAFSFYGTFFGFSYITPLIGGMLADGGLGKKATFVIGYLLSFLALYLLLFHPEHFFSWAFLFLALGYGFIRTVVTALIGQFARAEGLSEERSYKIFYLYAAYGFILAVLLGGYLYAAFSFGAILKMILVLLALSALLSLFPIYPKVENPKVVGPQEKIKSSPLLFPLLLLCSIPYYCAYVQMTTSMCYYLQHYVERGIGSFEIPTVWINALAALFSLTVTSFTPWLKKSKSARGELHFISVGLLISASAFLLLTLATSLSFEGNITTLLFFFLSYTVLGLGDMFIRPYLFSASSTYTSEKVKTLMTALIYAMIGVSVKVGSHLAAHAEKMGYASYFALFVGGTLLFAIVTKILDRRLFLVFRQPVHSLNNNKDS